MFGEGASALAHGFVAFCPAHKRHAPFQACASVCFHIGSDRAVGFGHGDVGVPFAGIARSKSNIPHADAALVVDGSMMRQ